MLRLIPLLVIATLPVSPSLPSRPVLFAQPGKMVKVGKGSALSLYCVGSGSPTVVLESGFGGGTAATWGQLQPRLGKLTRTCSYDRAGYGFSTLGLNLPRDLDRMVADLAVLLRRAGSPPPYILVGHSNGGLIISGYAKKYGGSVAALFFLDAAVVLPEDAGTDSGGEKSIAPDLQEHLRRIRACLSKAKAGLLPSRDKAHDCVDPGWYSAMPRALARAEIRNRSKVDFWRAYLSEAEANYGTTISRQARALLPHDWTNTSVRVFIASRADERNGRKVWVERQEKLCTLARDCRVTKVATANHLVHNAALDSVTAEVARQVSKLRGHGEGSTDPPPQNV